MKNKKIGIAIAIIAIVAAAGAFAQVKKVAIDYRYNLGKEEAAKDFFNWTADGKATKDKFDATKKVEHDGTAVTGASVSGSTETFNTVRYDANNKKTLPVTLRGLFLYPVSDRGTYTFDNLEVLTNADKSLTIRFIHRGTAYWVKTDAKGVIDIEKDAKMLAGVCNNVAGAFIVKPEYLKAGGDDKKMSSVDWAKVDPLLVPDVADSATTKYKGKLTAKYTGGVLTLKGNLAL